ncbi:hypothetical protein BSKO_01447 [Bryopsis sp. KO-2023]|nr:hypothetical protein BSKO_01447 [Bryopsis sp. KO-2023]
MDIRKFFAPTKGKQQAEKKEKDKSAKSTAEKNTTTSKPARNPSPKKSSSKAPAKSKRRRAVLSDSDEEDDLDFEPEEEDAAVEEDPMDLCDSDDEAPVRTTRSRVEKKPASVQKPSSTLKGSQTPTRPQEKRFKSQHPVPDASVGKAKAAVAAAIKSLPDESDLKFSVMDAGNVFGGGAPDDPPNHGAKEIPRGHPQCLGGYAFVISGVLDSLMRSEAEELIKRHSGRTTVAVSGKTSFLVCGENCGKSKYTQAKEKGTKLIDEDGLLSLILAAPAPTPTVIPSTLRTAFNDPGSTSAAMHHRSGSSASGEDELWVDKYKPKAMKDLVGNSGLIQELRSWLVNWKKNCAKAKPAENWKKAVILSGSPGVGKTSSARIVAEATGFRTLDVNASITRKKSDGTGTGKALGANRTNSLKIATTTHRMYESKNQAVEQVLIMDEVDGMGGGDRGGVTDLIATIKDAKIPIICICNDKYAVKLRSLRNHCQDFTYRKPSTGMIAKRMTEICQSEGLRFESTAVLNLLIDAAGGDLRLILGQLQTLSRTHSLVSYDEMKTFLLSVRKDSDCGPFKAADQLLSPGGSKAPMSDRLDLVFQDMDLVPLLVQENYLNHISTHAFDEKSQLAFASKAADLIACGETMNSLIRERQEWSLLPATIAVGTLAPAAYMCGKRRTFNSYEFNFTRFTSYLGNTSTKGKQMRLLTGTSNRMMAGMRSPLTPNSARLDYIPCLRTLLSRPLSTHGTDGIPTVIDFMHQYCLSKNEFDFVQDVTKFKSKQPWAADPYAAVDSKVKSAFTRMLNKSAAPVRTSLQIEEPKKGRTKKPAAAGDEIKTIEGEDPEMVELAVQKPNAVSEDEKSEEEVDAEAIIKSVGERMTVELAGSKRGGKSGGSRGRGRGRGSGRASGRGRGKGRGKK